MERDPAPPLVLCVAPYASPHVLPTCEALVARPEVRAVVSVLGRLPERRRRLGWVELDAASPHLQGWRRLRDRVRHAKLLWTADVVVLPGPFISKTMPLHFLVRRLSGRPLLFWSERFLDKRPLGALNLAVRRLLVRVLDDESVGLLAMPGAERDHAVIGASRWRAWRFAYAVEPAAGPASGGRGTGDPVRLTSVGELLPIKRVDLLLQALATQPLRHANWTLDVVGDGPERTALERLARETGLAERVAFLGQRPLEEARALMARSDVLVLASRFDGWGAVVPEALERGLAVVVSDAAGASEILRDAPAAGETFASGDVASLAEALARLVLDPGRLRLARGASVAAVSAWRPSALARRLAELSLSLVRGTSQPAPEFGPLRPVALDAARRLPDARS